MKYIKVIKERKGYSFFRAGLEERFCLRRKNTHSYMYLFFSLFTTLHGIARGAFLVLSSHFTEPSTSYPCIPSLLGG